MESTMCPKSATGEGAAWVPTRSSPARSGRCGEHSRSNVLNVELRPGSPAAKRRGGAFICLDIHPPPQDVDLRHEACRALEAILAPLRGRYMHYRANKLLRIPLPRRSVNKRPWRFT